MAKKGSNNTILVVALIFAVIVALVAIGLLMKSVSDQRKIENAISQSDAKAKTYKSQSSEILEQRNEAWKIISGDSSTGPGKYSGFKDGALSNARTDLESIVSAQWVSKEDSNLIRDQNIKRIWNDLRNIKEEIPKYDGLKPLNSDLLNRVKLLVHLIPRLRIKRGQKIEELDQALKQFDNDRASLNDRINKENQKLQGVNDKMLEEARQFDDSKRELQDELDRMNESQKTKDRIANLEIVKLRSEIQKLEQVIREIVKEERKTIDGIESDGQVVHSDPILGFAWINLGKQHNLKPGMIFDVYRTVKGGRTKLKGKVIVKAIEDNMAKTTIVRGAVMVDPNTNEEVVLPGKNDPIVKGDLIRSPLYDQEDSQRFVLLGKKTSNNVFRKEELVSKIENSGGKVDKTVGVGTNFVVLLTGAEEDFPDEIEKAAQFGVIFVKEKELINYLTR